MEKEQTPIGQDNLRFATDVLAAYDYFGRRIDTSKASPSAAAIHDWASNPENHKDFLQMAQRASDLIARNTKDVVDNEGDKSEHKSIAELKVFLAKEIEKSTAVS